MVQIQNQIIEDAAAALGSFPGIGKRTALRLVMHLIKRPESEIVHLADALIRLKTELHICHQCNSISDADVCQICQNKNRHNGLLCVVEDYNDLLAIENTGQYRGTYFVLGGLISPIDGIGPDQLNLDKLISIVNTQQIVEIVIALNTTIEGDTTLFYIAKLLQIHGVRISTISRGVSAGVELEYADEVTLGNSIANRVEYKF